MEVSSLNNISIRSLKAARDTVGVEIDQANDSIRMYSASGTNPIPTYLVGEADISINQYTDSVRMYSASGTSAIPVYCEQGLALEGSPNMTPLRTTQGTIVSTRNSSTATLTSGASFIGQPEESVDINAIQTIIKAEQPLTMYIDQSIDGINWDIVDSWTVASGVADARSVGSVAPYFRVRVQNDGSFTTGYLRLATGLTPYIAVQPRTLDEDGSLKTCIEKFHGQFDHDNVISPMGAQKTSSATRLAGAGFTGDIVDTNFWQTTVTGNATATQTAGTLTLSAGNPAANGSALVKSTRIARYVAANPNYYRGNVRCPAVTTTVGSNARRWGAFDENDGFLFEANQATGSSLPTLKLVCRKGGSDANTVTSGNFNGEGGASYLMDTNIHTYEIHWTNKNAWFIIDDVIIHKFTGSITTLVSSPSLKIGLQCLNAGGNTVANTLAVRSSTINRLGNLTTQPQYYYNSGTNAGTVLKYGAGNIHSLLVTASPTSGSVITLADGVAAGGATMLSSTITYPGGGNFNPVSYDLKGLPFASGLFLTVATQSSNLTVIYE